MPNTREWAVSHGLCVDLIVPPVDGYDKPHERTAAEVAIRAIILHCVTVVGYDVDSGPIIDWLKEQDIWDSASPVERAFLTNEARTAEETCDARWRQEAQWALLWSIEKVAHIGLPTQHCDITLLVDEVMPALGNSITGFVSSSTLRSPAELLAEDDRVYNLHCYARQAFREGSMPSDLIYDVLFQRHYAFSWLDSQTEWDAVRTDT